MTQAPEAGGRKFLHVGCGHKRKGATIKPFAAAEWQEVTLDIDEAVSPDLIDGLPELASVPTGAFDAVYSAHNLEHLFPHEVAPALAAFRRVLKDDGFAVITCPDLQTIGDRLAADDLETPLYTSPSGPVSAARHSLRLQPRRRQRRPLHGPPGRIYADNDERSAQTSRISLDRRLSPAEIL